MTLHFFKANQNTMVINLLTFYAVSGDEIFIIQTREAFIRVHIIAVDTCFWWSAKMIIVQFRETFVGIRSTIFERYMPHRVQLTRRTIDFTMLYSVHGRKSAIETCPSCFALLSTTDDNLARNLSVAIRRVMRVYDPSCVHVYWCTSVYVYTHKVHLSSKIVGFYSRKQKQKRS